MPLPESPPPSQPEFPHVVINLDQELQAQALVECLQLAEDLQRNPGFSALICPALRLRLAYVLLHAPVPEYRREELRKLALHHNQLATSLISAQSQARLQAQRLARGDNHGLSSVSPRG